jgi:hypothetical protein
MPRDNYLLVFPQVRPHSKLLDIYDMNVGGSGYNQQQQIENIPEEWQGQTHYEALNLPPFGCVVYEKSRRRNLFLMQMYL